jgi:hypothetical protein
MVGRSLLLCFVWRQSTAALPSPLKPRGQRRAHLDRFNRMEVNFLRGRAA